ncbi:glycosyltransferase [Streptacidiphilus rugosus]|uniref:glycosyltransferase n=1 Tax=Streptacidiphilus rugosus TaxID=405783 RepID=UPI00068C0C4F|nr:glycosyltransferase family 4 protein [Streptacidiphilus rugosus]
MSFRLPHFMTSAGKRLAAGRQRPTSPTAAAPAPSKPAETEGAALRRRADELAEAARGQLERGEIPDHLADAYAAELACADSAYEAGRSAEAAGSLAKALLLAFHRVPQVDSLTTPVSDDASGFTAPLRASSTAMAVVAPRGRRTPAARRPADRPLRLLFVTHGNANFLKLLVEHYQDHPEVDVRTLDLGQDEEMAPLAKGLKRMAHAALGGEAEYREAVERALRPHLDWADTVFVEWCTGAAAFLTLVDPGSTRIVVRLHRFETFSFWPHVIDFSRVDDLLFIADHMIDLTTDVVPRLLEAGGPRLQRTDNAVELGRFVRPKGEGARFTVGLVGMAQVAKDPLWAVQVLRALREQDERYRLVLVGNGMNPDVSPAARAYHDRLEAELTELEATGAVERLGQSDDVPGLLTGVGTILSSSVREGCHVGLMEGAASGAVPVVRDWPMVAGRPHSARTLFPQEWVVDTPERAAARILALTGDEETWRKAGQEASAHALATWDWEVVRPDYDRLLLGS